MYVRKGAPEIRHYDPKESLHELRRRAIENQAENPPFSASMYVLSKAIQPYSAYLFKDVLSLNGTELSISRSYFVYDGRISKNNPEFYLRNNARDVEMVLVTGYVHIAPGHPVMVLEAGFVDCGSAPAIITPATSTPTGLLLLDKGKYDGIISTTHSGISGSSMEWKSRSPELNDTILSLQDAIMQVQSYFSKKEKIPVH